MAWFRKTMLVVGMLFVMLFSATEGIFCWTCRDAGSDEHCFKIGKWARCHITQRCYVEQRYANGVETHIRGCKQNTACDALESQNEFQCNAELFKLIVWRRPKAPITCRHCCSTDRCNPTEAKSADWRKFEHFPTVSYPTTKPRPTPTRRPRTRRPRTRVTTTPVTAKVVTENPPMSLGEVYYPGVGWIGLQKLDQNGRPTPPPLADVPANGNVSKHLFNYIRPPLEVLQNETEMKEHKRRQICTNGNDPLLRAPREFSPKEECVVPVAMPCVSDGTLVLNIGKLPHEERHESSKKKSADDLCVRTPLLKTVMVYDEEDHYVMIVRFAYRDESGLPSRVHKKSFVGDSKLIDLIGKKNLKRFQSGNG